MSNLIIPSRPWVFLPKLAKAVGLKEAIILQQFHWILVDAGLSEMRMSLDDWCEIFYFIPSRTMRRCLEKMVQDQLLIKKPWDGGALVWSINYPAVDEAAKVARQPAKVANENGQGGQVNDGQSGQADLFIRYILKDNIYPLNGDSEKLDFELLKRQAPHELFVTWWNAVARQHGLVVCNQKKAGRSKEVARVISEGFLENLPQVERGLKENPWYAGANDQGWVADIEWILKPGKWQQVARFVSTKKARAFTYKEALDYCQKHMLSPDLPKHFEQVEGKKWRLKI